MSDCIFCKIAKGEVPTQFIHETDNVIVFKDIHPQANYHYLVIPKFHVESVAHLKADQLGIIEQMYTAALQVAENQKFKDLGFRTVINTGKHGGQTVFHLHMHLMSDAKIKPGFGA